jgi:hypothetical protein
MVWSKNRKGFDFAIKKIPKWGFYSKTNNKKLSILLASSNALVL